MSSLFKTQEIKKIEIVKQCEKVEEQNNVDTNKEEISKYINNNRLLTINELIQLSNKTTTYKTDRMTIYNKHIGDNLVVVRDCIFLYCDKLNIYFKSAIPINNFLILYLLILKEKSHKALTEQQKQLLPLSKINDYETQHDINLLVNFMRKPDNYFDDPKLDQIHFMNGYINLKDSKLYERTKSDKMTYCIMSEFKEPTKKGLNKMINVINQVYPDVNDRNNILSMYADGMTGRVPQKQFSLFLLGLGGAGKSIILNMLKIAFQDYVFQLKEDTLSVYNNKQDRILNMFIYKKFVRIAFINELVGKINDSIFKQLAEGKIQTTTLFQEGMNDIILNALMVFISNDFPNIKIDSGVSRRLRGLYHQSQFTYDKSKVNPKENIYYRDDKLLETFANDEDMKNALIYIIIGYAKEIYDGVKYSPSQNMVETKETIQDANNIVGKFKEIHIIETKNEKDKMRLEELHTFFKSKFPKSLLTETQLRACLEELGIKYNRNLKFKIGQKEVRGGYNGIKLNSDTIIEEDEEENPLDHGIEYKFGKTKTDEKDEIIDRQNKEIEELKAKLKQLEEQLKPKEVPKQTPKETIQEQLTFKDIDDLTTKTIKSTKSKKSKTTVIKQEYEAEKDETNITTDDIFNNPEFNKFLSMKKK
jgi:hypothetical protein